MTGTFGLEGYEVQCLLGFGSTGEVWRARELATGDLVALKRLRPGADRSAVDLLRREASLLRTLDTPYVVRLRAVLGGDDDAVLVLDHAGGGSLAALLTRRGSLDAGEVVTIAGPLAAALATAHRQGLVHGDVSPANVLFTADGMPLLSDLGVAFTVSEPAGSRRVDGTAEYLDPAVVAGGAPDAPADVWALAAVCHHMLAGSPPHEGSSTEDVLHAALAGERAPLGLLAPSAPRALVAAIEAGLQRDPAARPSAAELASLIRRSHGTAPVRLSGTASSAVLPEPRPTTVVRSWSAVQDARGPGLLARVLARLTRGRGRVRGRGRGRSGRHCLPPAPAESRGSSGTSRSRVGIAALGLAVIAAAVLGWVSAGGSVREASAGPPPAAAAPTPARTPPVPVPAGPTPAELAALSPAAAAQALRPVVERLDAARAAAFRSGEVAQLSSSSVDGSPARAGDVAALERLAARGQSVHGLSHRVASVELVRLTGDRARLLVVDERAAYEVRGPGAGRTPVNGRATATHRLDLRYVASGWRIEDSAGA